MSSTTRRAEVLFTPPEDQVATVREWNAKHGWGFTEEQFSRAAEDIPELSAYRKRRFSTLTLVPYLPDLVPGSRVPTESGLHRTFDALCALIREEHPSFVGAGAADFNAGAILRFFNEPEHVPGLRFEAIDLGANWQPQALSQEGTFDRFFPDFPHAGVLASLALHAAWAYAIDGKTVPWVLFPGYVVEEPGVPAFYVPRAYRGGQGLALDRVSSNHEDSRCAVPVLLLD